MKINSQSDQYPENDISLLAYWSVIWANKWIIILIFGITVSLTGISLSLTPKTYLAEASLLLMDQKGGSLLAGALGSMPFADFGDADPVSKLTVILESKTMAQEIVDQFKITDYLTEVKKKEFSLADNFPFLKKSAQDAPTLNDKEINRKNAIAVKYLKDNIFIKSGKGGLVKISIEWPDPSMGAQIINSYIFLLGTFMNDNSIKINFKVIDPAQPPIDKHKPNVSKTLMLSAVASIIGSLLIVFLKEALYTRKEA